MQARSYTQSGGVGSINVSQLAYIVLRGTHTWLAVLAMASNIFFQLARWQSLSHAWCETEKVARYKTATLHPDSFLHPDQEANSLCAASREMHVQVSSSCNMRFSKSTTTSRIDSSTALTKSTPAVPTEGRDS